MGSSWPWMARPGLSFSTGCRLARPCCVSQVILLTSPVQYVIPYQHPSHGSQPSGVLTPCLAPVSPTRLTLSSSSLPSASQYEFPPASQALHAAQGFPVQALNSDGAASMSGFALLPQASHFPLRPQFTRLQASLGNLGTLRGLCV
jgi:hypothetical protein